ncbi:MAG: RNA methyltransferase [Anaerolineae bacterium]|jgi:TrmH family RNA methyltransferase
MITSLSNEKVKFVRRLQAQKAFRRRERCLVLEGVRLVGEAVRAGLAPDLVLYEEGFASESRHRGLLDALSALDAPCHIVSESVIKSCSDTMTPQGILAVLPFPELSPPTPLTFVLILDRLRDPGNLGTILRTALAAGVEQVLLVPGTVDWSNPKVVRSAMGAHLRLPIAEASWESIAEEVSGCETWLAAAQGGKPYTNVDWVRPAALIVGSEAHGAGDQARAFAGNSVSVPMCAGVESLNAAVAAATILFEVVRQRATCSPVPTTAIRTA